MHNGPIQMYENFNALLVVTNMASRMIESVEGTEGLRMIFLAAFPAAGGTGHVFYF